MDEKATSFFRFEDLRIYGKAVDYGKWLVFTLKEPRNEHEKVICNSFISSSIDISLNIAEGSSRNRSQFDHYLKISKTAIRECIIYSTLANKLGLLNDEEMEQSREYLMELTRMIGALIISLQRRRGEYEGQPSDYSMPSPSVDSDFDDSFGDIN